MKGQLLFLLLMLTPAFLIAQPSTSLSSMDTVLANKALESAKKLRKERSYNQALDSVNIAYDLYARSVGDRSDEVGEALYEKAIIYFQQNQFDLAIADVKKALQIWLSNHGKQYKRVADAYYNLAYFLDAKSDFKEAIVNYQQCLKIRKGLFGVESKEIATVYNALGNTLADLGDFKNSIEYLERALAIRIQLFGEKHFEVASVHMNLGSRYHEMGNYDQALEYHNKALVFLLTDSSSQRSLAGTYLNMANCYEGKGDHEKAIELHEKSLDLFKGIMGEVSAPVAQVYNNLGNSYSSKGNLRQAIEFYNKALKIRLEIFGESHMKIAETYNNMGNRYLELGDHQKALEYQLSSLNIRIPKLGMNSPSVADTYGNLANIYTELGDLSKAILFHNKALNIRLSVFGSNSPYVLISCSNLGNIYAQQGLFDKAILYFKKGLPILKNVLGDEHPAIIGYYGGLGNAYLAVDSTETALDFYFKANEITIKNFGNAHPDVIRNYNNIAKVYFDRREFQNARKFVDSTLDISMSLYGKDGIKTADALLRLAKMELAFNGFEKADSVLHRVFSILGYQSVMDLPNIADLSILSTALSYEGIMQEFWFKRSHRPQNLEKAKKSYLQADQTWDYRFLSFGEEARTSFMNIKHTILKHLIAVNQNLRSFGSALVFDKESFDFSERAKAYLLFQAMQESQALQFGGVSDDLLKKEVQLKIAKAKEQNTLKNMLQSGQDELDERVIAVNSRLFEIDQALEDLRNRLAKDHPKYYQLKYDFTTASLDYVQDTLLEAGQTLLEYFVSDSTIFAFIIKQGEYELIELTKDFPLENLIKKLRDGLYGFYGKSQKDQTDVLYRQTLSDYVSSATTLYEKLIDPINEKLSDEIILIPDGILGYIPFEALLEHKPTKVSNFDAYPFLFHKHQISYCYSATLLREMKDKVHRNIPKKILAAFAPFATGTYADIQRSTELDLLQLANGQDSIVYKEVITRKDFRQLPSSGSEAYLAAKIMGGDAFVGEEATEDHFNATAGDYRILHLSTHGIADERVGDYSYLAFAEQKDSLENEFLYVRDLYNLQLNADLVVLSACETASGELKRGEGIISLARAFAYAGAKSILTTLWVVDDAVAKDLTRDFYIHLKQGKTKDQALYLAKQQHLERSNNSRRHPFFWAAMIPVGDMSPIK